ncbi:MAG: hypothetical protein MJY84_02535 [Bacteroidales bacterium]|nr:hypothetical protein [Bacteroidales bacterium]
MAETKQRRKWKLSDVGHWFKDAFRLVVKGEFLLKTNVSKYFIHIIYTFFLFWISIFLSLKIEKTMTRVEDNRKVLEDMEIYHAQKTVELVRLGRISTIEEMLKEKGSEVTMPEKPAERIK